MRKTPRVTITLVATALTSAALSLVGPIAPASAAGVLLYSNGGLNPVAASTSGVAAPAGYYWSEAQHDVAVPSVANTTGHKVEHGEYRQADDFTVPAGQAWTIDSVDVVGFASTDTAAPIIGATLRIWSGVPGASGSRVVFGDPSTNRLRSSVDTHVYRIADSTGGAAPEPPDTMRKMYLNSLAVAGVTLPGGTYWIDYDLTATGSLTAASPTLTIPGSRGVAGWNARIAEVGGWRGLIDAGYPLSGADVPQDIPFNVNGTVTYPAPDTSFGKTPKSKMTKKKVDFSFSSDQAGATFQCSLNGAAFAACAGKVTVKGTKGKNTLIVRAVSAYGVADATPAAYTWKYKKKKKHPHHGGGGY